MLLGFLGSSQAVAGGAPEADPRWFQGRSLGGFQGGSQALPGEFSGGSLMSFERFLGWFFMEVP